MTALMQVTAETPPDATGGMRVAFFGPRYNIAPTQLAPVIFMENKKPVMKLMRWGLIPSWAKDETTGNALIRERVAICSVCVPMAQRE